MIATTSIKDQLAIIFDICAKHGVNSADLRRAFPNRPTTDLEVMKVAQWVSQHIAAMQATTDSLSGTQQATSINPPRPSLPQGPSVVVKDGYFAIPAGAIGFEKPHFFRLNHGSPKGRWATTQFMTEQASDEHYPVKGKRKAEILRYLHGNEQACRELYGTLISRCSRCNRTLTDHNNPYFPAYGPECGGK